MDREVMQFISEEVHRQLATAISTSTAADALGHQALQIARQAQTEAAAAIAVAGQADQNSKLARTDALTAKSAADIALVAKQNQDQHVIDLMYSKFKDFFHEALLRYLDYNRKDYDKTLRDWAFAKVTAWTKK